MSKTRNTAPERIRALQRPEFMEERHDHDGRGCDLPAIPALTDRSIYGPASGCAWVASDAYFRQEGCGCKNVGCNCYYGTPRRKAKARRARQAGRAESRRWRDEN